MNSRETLRGDAAMAIVEREIMHHGDAVIAHLAPFEAAGAIATWHAAIRSAEEFINIPQFAVPGAVEHQLLSLPLGDALAADPSPAIAARDLLKPLLGEAVARRFMLSMIQLTIASVGLRESGRSLAGGFVLDTVAAGIDFLQSRRRHMVSLLYAIPKACTGTQALAPELAWRVMLPLLEYCCDGVTGWSGKKIQLLCLPDFALELDGVGAMASQAFNPLGPMFLEPERVSIMDMIDHRGEQIGAPRREPQDPRLVFSAAELRNNVRLLEAVFTQFGVDDAAYSAIKRLLILCSRHCRDDYYVELPRTLFDAAIVCQDVIPAPELEALLISPSGSYADCSNDYAPFLALGDRLISNVVLLSRFANMFKNLHLGSRRRFLSNAGFIFEDMVKRDLAKAGFTVTDIKRINRKEFDVVTTLGQVIHNFQCKNNWIDLARVERDPVLYARYNRRLVRYYKRALGKERRREGLLTETLARDKIRHHVVSRFAVITDDSSIINYNQLGMRAQAIIAEAG